MTNLYKLADDYKALVTLRDDDIPAEAVQDTLDGIKGAIQDKAVNIILLEKNIEGDIAAITTEIKRLQSKKKARENFANRMREYLRYNMMVTGITKIQHALFSITLGKPGKIVVVDNEDELPDDYIDMQTIYKPNKKKLADDLKAGKDIPGAHLEDGQHKLIVR